MAEQGLTIILPSAGLGKRLGVNTPKELLEIHPGVPVIRFSLGHILASLDQDRFDVKIAVVIRKGKESVVDYVRGILPSEIEVRTVYADPQWKEWPGSIYSAREHYSDHNLVLLPDSFLALSEIDWLRNSDNRTLIDLALFGLAQSQIVFGTLYCPDCERLKRLGAVRQQENGEIIAFQDKPDDPTDFNAFWGCFAFRREVGEALHQFLGASVRHANPDYPAQSFYPACSFPLIDYADLGTWEAVKAFRLSYPPEKLGIAGS